MQTNPKAIKIHVCIPAQVCGSRRDGGVLPGTGGSGVPSVTPQSGPSFFKPGSAQSWQSPHALAADVVGAPRLAVGVFPVRFAASSRAVG